MVRQMFGRLGVTTQGETWETALENFEGAVQAARKAFKVEET